MIQLNISSEPAQCLWLVFLSISPQNTAARAQTARVYSKAEKLQVSWIKRDQLDVTCLLFHYLMPNMFWMLIHPSTGACDLFVELFHGLYCSGLMCVGVTVWFAWGGVVSGCRLQPDTTPPQPNHTVTPTHIKPEQYNPWNNSSNKSQAPEDGCINIRNMLSSKLWNNKASDIKLVSVQLSRWCTVQ